MSKENEKDTSSEELEEIETPTPQVEENDQDDVADQLTDKELTSKITEIIDERLSLADEAEDNEEELPEEEEKEEKGIGVLPYIIFGVLALGATTLLLTQNRPDIDQHVNGEQTHG